MSYERISPTAWLVAYQRALSDIPLSSEIFDELEEIVKQTRTASEIERIEALKSSRMAVMWEARFKIVNHVLKAHHPDQFFEIAAGFSTRGLDIAARTPVTYVEVDLPGVIAEKRRIVETLIARGEIPARSNFHLAEGNALNLADLLSATRFFADRPVAVINEGLLPYLDRADRTTFARNVYTVLERFGGIWITPDIDIQLPEADSSQSAAAVRARTARIEDLTGIDVLKNRFESEEAARVFFEQLGFHVERHSFMEVADQLVLPPQGSLAQKAIQRGILFVMTPAGH
jgi:O-methyltransferase involved in polyketide biosynthesis